MVSQLFEKIKVDIISQQLKPGQKLPERVLAEKYEVSRTPIRQALQQLSSLGLVEFIPNKGAFVKSITLEQYKDIFQVRMVLEGFATELCCESEAKDDIVLKLENIMNQANEAVLENDYKIYSTLDQEFHQTIVNGSKNQELIAISDDLNQKAYVARLRSLALPGQVEKSFQDHFDIMECIRMGEAKKARERAEVHVYESINRYYEYTNIEKMLLQSIKKIK
ncbi:GntR family transcriptional regulator [bacterium LRH843]|nr:GntR family transcriptional regulator [bacterium LRH843]